MRKYFFRVFGTVLAIMFCTFAFQAQSVSAAGDVNFTYNKETGYLEGTLNVSERLTRLVIYVTSGYDYAGTRNILAQDVSSGNYFTLKGSTVLYSDSQIGTTDIVYGGVVPVPAYGMDCLIYYIITENNTPAQWNIHVLMDSLLREVFVAKSVVPSNWQNSSSAPVITNPKEFCLGFINSATSSYTATDIKSILQHNAVEVDEGEFTGEIIEEEQKDPVQTLILVLIVVTVVGIVATGILISKEKKKKAAEKSEAFVKKANAKLKAKKGLENEELKDLLGSYETEYEDDEPSANQPVVPNDMQQINPAPPGYEPQPGQIPIPATLNPTGVPQPGVAPLGTMQHGMMQPGMAPHNMTQPVIMQPGMMPPGLAQPAMNNPQPLLPEQQNPYAPQQTFPPYAGVSPVIPRSAVQEHMLNQMSNSPKPVMNQAPHVPAFMKNPTAEPNIHPGSQMPAAAPMFHQGTPGTMGAQVQTQQIPQKKVPAFANKN